MANTLVLQNIKEIGYARYNANDIVSWVSVSEVEMANWQQDFAVRVDRDQL